jgi:hypothetical protein
MTTNSSGRVKASNTGRTETKSSDKDTRVAAKDGRTVPARPLAPCYGRWTLFDSTDQADHREAKALCESCSIIASCISRLSELQRTSGSYAQPEGTWAGQLLTPDSQTNRLSRDDRLREKYDAEEAAYTEEQARQANRDYLAGDHGPWAKTGHRVHSRRKRRNARKKVA